MEILIKDKTITLKKTFRSLIAYESATGKPFAPKTITDYILYFYCVVIASDTALELSYDEFIDWLDTNENAINDFTTWLTKQSEAESKLSKKKTTKTKKVE